MRAGPAKNFDKSPTSGRPLVGFTSSPRRRFEPLQWLTALAVWLAGGRPVSLRPDFPREELQLDALIIGGGTDLYPALFDLEPRAGYSYERERDEMEMRWLKQARARGLPVLGICRGAQMINVERGGSLHVDLSKVYAHASYPSGLLARVFYRKAITVVRGSGLSSLMGGRYRLWVNSMHKQAIDRLGQGLVVCAREDNGVVQAVEDPRSDFLLGVQFHPEALIYRRRFRNLFSMLVKAAARRRE